MILSLQDPTNPDSEYLLESILECVVKADSGAAAFAWATQSGIRLLIEDKSFLSFLARGTFELIIGVDAVTTKPTLELLTDLTIKHESLSVSVFHEPDSSALFHPKFTWFESSNGGEVIVGSGNLTGGGLRNNWEAYAHHKLNIDELEAVKHNWTDWKTRHSTYFWPSDHVDIAARAEKNRTTWLKKVRKAPSKTPIDGKSKRVLIAEIPRAGDRWNQANFSRKVYEEFFGALVGTQRRILLQQVTLDGELRPFESRPSVEVVSHNWRFELNAAAGLSYPATGRPIGVFIELKPRTFRYMLLMPGGKYYSEVLTFLNNNEAMSPNKMRRHVHEMTNVESLAPIQLMMKSKSDAFLEADI